MGYHAKHGKGATEKNGRDNSKDKGVFRKRKSKGFDSRRAVTYDETLDSGTLDALEDIRAHEDALYSPESGGEAEKARDEAREDDGAPFEDGAY